jgi:glutaredoxin
MSSAARLLVVAAWLGLAGTALTAGAQPIYRIVGPDGKVTFSDRPPAEPTTRASTAPVVPLPPGGAGGGASLPFELRNVANRYPVVLYTQAECGPCDNGRSLLSGRGIPFTEKTIATREDAEALQRLSGGGSLPLLTVGGQRLQGFSAVEWQQFLDAAGYPKTSQLPASYRQPPATPLVAAQAAQPQRPRQEQAQQAPAPVPAEPRPVGPTPENPAGIQF